MGYGGYLIRVGDYTLPFEYIQSDTYKCGIKGQDLDSYNDANGIFRRNALENVAIKAEFNTPSPISEDTIRPFLDKIREQFIDKNEKKALVTMWMPEIGKYVIQECYEPDIDFEIQYADENEVIYNSFRLAFIGYGGKVW